VSNNLKTAGEQASIPDLALLDSFVIRHSDFVVRLASLLVCLALSGCTTTPQSSPASRQREEADLVIAFQSWNSISFMKPDITGMAGAQTVRAKTFTRAAVVKLLRNLKTPRGFVVVVLDRRYAPDPMAANGGMDEIQRFFEELGFRRIAIQDGAALDETGGLPILRDSTIKPRRDAGAAQPAAGA